MSEMDTQEYMVASTIADTDPDYNIQVPQSSSIGSAQGVHQVQVTAGQHIGGQIVKETFSDSLPVSLTST